MNDITCTAVVPLCLWRECQARQCFACQLVKNNVNNNNNTCGTAQM